MTPGTGSTPSSLGRHLLVELTGCGAALLEDVEHVRRSMVAAAEASGALVVGENFHHFSPHGVSGVVIISESHLAIHTWPEYGFAAIDLFTCGETVDPWAAFDVLQRAFQSEATSVMEVRRGTLRIPGLRHKPEGA